MSFAQGFASTFVPLLGQAVSNMQQYELDRYNEKIAEFKQQRKVYEDGVQTAERLKEQAQLIAQSVPGTPPDAWKAIYNDLYMGRSIESVRKDALEGGFTRRNQATTTGPMGGVESPAGASPAVPMGPSGVADQMVQSGLATTEQVPTTDSKLDIQPGSEDDSINFSFAKWMDRRVEDRFKGAVGASDEEIAQVRAGFKASPYDTEFVLNPARTGDKESTALTPAKVSAEYAKYAEAAASGDPAAVKAFQDYKNTRLPILVEALGIGKEGKPMNIDIAWNALQEAKKSGDQERIDMAEAEFQSQLDKEAMVAAAKTSSNLVPFVSIDGQGNVKTTLGSVRPTAQGNVLRDYLGRPLEGEWRPTTEDEQKRRKDLEDTVTYKSRMDYQTEVSQLASALDLIGEIDSIVSSDDLVLTGTAGAVADVSSLFREVSAVGQVFNSIAQRGGPISEKALTDELVRQKVLRPGQSLQTLAAEDVLGSRTASLASKRRALDAKMVLAAYRIAGLEGQQGQGLSDKDVQRMQILLRPSSDVNTFRENLASYARDRIETLEDKGQFFIEAGRGFESQYGYNPMKGLVTTLQEQVDRRPGAKRGYAFATGTPTTMERVGTQQPPATQTQPAPAPTAPATITSDEEYQQLPSGSTFRGPDGVLRRKP